MPLGTAFNIGTVLPIALLPIATYFGVKLLGLRFPTPILASAASMLFLYNESYSMWGGNTLSTLAGQFAHLYAFCLLIFSVGFFTYEFRKKRAPILSSFLFTLVTCCHGYVVFGLPLIMLAFIFFYPKGNLKNRFISAFQAGVMTFLLSIWFLVPMFDNAPWTTAFFIFWSKVGLLEKVVPRIIYPALILIPLTLVFIFLRAKVFKVKNKNLWSFYFWLVPVVGYMSFYYLFPIIGLVDTRAFPQIIFFICVLSGTLLGITLRSLGSLVSVFLVIPIFLANIWWTNDNVTRFSRWLHWNYSGWTNKVLYDDLMQLSDHIRGDFSDPRVIYEHSSLNNGAGTIRVFEMLPYFSGRATMESLYLQASVLAPTAFYLQAKVSKAPSCPFRQFPCTSYVKDKEGALNLKEKLELAGVGGIILLTKEIKDAFKDSLDFTEGIKFGPWTYLELKKDPKYVEVLDKRPKFVDEEDWKKVFYLWYDKYSGHQNLLISSKLTSDSIKQTIEEMRFEKKDKLCKPSVSVDFNRLVLKTDCPGRVHLLKFSYNPSWKASTGDEIFMLSPGSTLR